MTWPSWTCSLLTSGHLHRSSSGSVPAGAPWTSSVSPTFCVVDLSGVNVREADRGHRLAQLLGAGPRLAARVPRSPPPSRRRRAAGHRYPRRLRRLHTGTNNTADWPVSSFSASLRTGRKALRTGHRTHLPCPGNRLRLPRRTGPQRLAPQPARGSGHQARVPRIPSRHGRPGEPRARGSQGGQPRPDSRDRTPPFQDRPLAAMTSRSRAVAARNNAEEMALHLAIEDAPDYLDEGGTPRTEPRRAA